MLVSADVGDGQVSDQDAPASQCMLWLCLATTLWPSAPLLVGVGGGSCGRRSSPGAHAPMSGRH